MKNQILILMAGCLLGLVMGCGGNKDSSAAMSPAAEYMENAAGMEVEEAGAEAPALMTADSTPMPANKLTPAAPASAARAAEPTGRRRRLSTTPSKQTAEAIVMKAEKAAGSLAQHIDVGAPGEAAAESRKSVSPKETAKRLREALELSPMLSATPEQDTLKPRASEAKHARANVAPPSPSESPAAHNPEMMTRDNPFSTFSMNVSDVSFKLAAASLERQRLPEPATVRAEEFFNAMDYHDPAPTSDAKLAFAWERAGHPFAHNRDLIRFSIQTGAKGREKGRPLNLVVLLDRSGSMERADRAAIVRRAMRSLAEKLTAQDRISVVAFARTPRLWVDGMRGGDPDALLERIDNLTPEGGTNLEAALDLGYEIAARHFRRDGVNRVILLTDGAANLGDVEPAALKLKAETQRKQGIALDCFGVGWDGYNDVLLEMLSRNADGRYGFLNDVHEAGADFSEQLAGALRVAAADVKVQVEFNPSRVVSYRQIGYEKRQLKKEDFRDNSVDAAEIGAAESGTGVYAVQIDQNGVGPLGVVRVRFLNPATGLYEERSWTLFHRRSAPSLADSSAAMRLAGCSALFAEWLAGSPYAGGVSLPELLACLGGTLETFANDPRPAQLAAMIRQAQMIAGAAGGS